MSNRNFNASYYPNVASVEVMRLNANAVIPTRAHGGDAGIDISLDKEKPWSSRPG
jgi:hypothetical protein